MIAKLEGKVVHISEHYVVLDVSGVGYKVFATGETLQKITKIEGKVALWTHLSVRDDALNLYGFLEKETHDFFILLITVSGIGPKSALAILNIAAVATLRKAISKGDPAYVAKISGIGSKKAEKIVLELKDKLHLSEEEMKGDLRGESDAIETLEALGYSERDSRDALKKISADVQGFGWRYDGNIPGLQFQFNVSRVYKG